MEIGTSSLHTLRKSLERSLGERAASFLQEAGYAAGADLYDRFAAWLLDEAGIEDPGELDAEFLPEMLQKFFAGLGWGAPQVEAVGNAGMAISSPEWSEAEPGGGASYPSCHVSTGLLASFMTKLADDTVAVMEVECRTKGDERCTFVLGSPGNLQTVYDSMSSGRDYKAAFAGR